MSTARTGLAAGVLSGRLYALGPGATMEVFDPAANKWAFGPSMSTARSDLAAGVLGGKLYAVGGMDGSSTLDSAECYDPDGDAWTSLPSVGREICGCGVAVLDCVAHEKRGEAALPPPPGPAIPQTAAAAAAAAGGLAAAAGGGGGGGGAGAHLAGV